VGIPDSLPGTAGGARPLRRDRLRVVVLRVVHPTAYAVGDHFLRRVRSQEVSDLLGFPIEPGGFKDLYLAASDLSYGRTHFP
jgi:hypothetical protein